MSREEKDKKLQISPTMRSTGYLHMKSIKEHKKTVRSRKNRKRQEKKKNHYHISSLGAFGSCEAGFVLRDFDDLPPLWSRSLSRSRSRRGSGCWS